MKLRVLAAFIAASSPALAADPGIIIHAGSWETHTTLASPPGQTLPVRRVCRPVDQSLDAAAIGAIKSRPNTTCEQPSFAQSGNTATYALSCAIGTVHVQMKGTITSDGPDSFTNHMLTHAEMANGQKRDLDMLSVTKRVGACEPGEEQSKD